MRRMNMSGLVSMVCIVLACQVTVLGQFRLDHFKVYDAKDVAVGEERRVELQGQFDDALRPSVLMALTHFANSVSKNGSVIIDKHAHFTWYRLKPDLEKEPERTVEIENQFGKQTLVLGDGAYLLAPAEKKETASSFPKGLDHFKCYIVKKGPTLDVQVSLQDQFGNENSVQVGQARFFCVPVVKVFQGKRFPIQNPADHLTVYDIAQSPRKANDQFRQFKLVFDPCQMLCVPSKKNIAPEHFKVYKLNDEKVDFPPISLKGQFDQAYQKVRLLARTYFANPVKKNDEAIKDSSRHLTWYSFRRDAPPDPERTVEVTNQFGTYILNLGQPLYLLSPTRKIEERSRFPEELDHYVAYEVLKGNPAKRIVNLEDQFGIEKDVEVGLPKFLCVPVEKIHGDTTDKIKNPGVHLTVYEINPRRRNAQDQFVESRIEFESCEYLCVPSTKRRIETGLDHFLFYEISSQSRGEVPVDLRGQFDELATRFIVLNATHFGNPVSKNGEAIADRSHHFLWYNIRGEPERKREVDIENQFGGQTLVLGNATQLLVPTQKIDGTGLPPPQGLDHFKCYEVLDGSQVSGTVSLEDQFGTQPNVGFGQAKFFCVPVQKARDGNVEAIHNADAHLTIYAIDRGPGGRQISGIDQFGDRSIFVQESVLLGVPTKKLRFRIMP